MIDNNGVTELQGSQDYHIGKIIEHLRMCEQTTKDNLADFISALCNVPKEEMLSNTHVVYCAHARYLYWYAFRYMTNESYENIAIQCGKDGHRYTQSAISAGVNKMSVMIETEPLWNKRWVVVKKIIKSKSQDNAIDNTIVIQVPKDLKGKINISIKDK